MPEVHASIHGDKAFKDAFKRLGFSRSGLGALVAFLNSVTAAEIIQADKGLILPFLAWFIRQRIKDFAAQRLSERTSHIQA